VNARAGGNEKSSSTVLGNMGKGIKKGNENPMSPSGGGKKESIGTTRKGGGKIMWDN